MAGLGFDLADFHIGMSRRDMKVGRIETKMVGIDRRAPGQNKIMDSDFIQLNNSVQITQQDFQNIPDVVVPKMVTIILNGACLEHIWRFKTMILC